MVSTRRITTTIKHDTYDKAKFNNIKLSEALEYGINALAKETFEPEEGTKEVLQTELAKKMKGIRTMQEHINDLNQEITKLRSDTPQ